MKVDKQLCNNVHLRWKIRSKFAHYYLKYIDLENHKNLNDEKKIMLAWWMAREAEQAMMNNIPGISIKQENHWLDKSILLNVAGTIDKIKLKHFFNAKKRKRSVSRYLTLFGSTSLIEITMALLYSQADTQYLFQVIHRTTFQLEPKFYSVIRDELVQHIILGKYQRNFSEKEGIPLLWHTPLAVSTPAFLRGYYKDDFSQLTDTDRQFFEAAEKMAKDDFLSNHVEYYSSLEKKRFSEDISNLLFSLLVSWRLNGSLSKQSTTFLERKNILTEILSISYPTNIKSFLALISLIGEVIQWEKPTWVDDLLGQIKKIDFTNLAIGQKDMEDIISGLVSIIYSAHLN
ncbi:MAG: hypothetical protein KAW12_22485 [Candidatus Aminicenantes bacterium]|nr:hypothetical protein [Candidatus Aminicenantes bacterium]